MKKCKKSDCCPESFMDFWIVSFVNSKDSGLNRIVTMFRSDVECRWHLDSMRCWMRSDDQDSVHMFPEEWSVVYDHYQGGCLNPDDTRIVPVTALKVETK